MNCLARPLLLVLAPLLLALVLSGCVILPIPIPPRGTQVDLESTKFVVGDTTRADVHALLGAPAHTASARYDVWKLERDPFHLHWIILFGGPGYATGADFRTGEVIGYTLMVEYDEAGTVANWQWLAADGLGRAIGAPAPSSPSVPIKRHEWQAAQVVAIDDSALLVTIDEPRRLTIERIALDDGRRLDGWTGDPLGCRLPFALSPGGAMTIDLADGALVSAPPAMTPDAMPCRWERHADGTMVATRLPGLAVPERTVAVRLTGERLVRQDRETGLAVLSLAGETLASATTAAGRLEAVAAAADADRLLVRHLRPTQRQPDFRLIETAGGQVAELPALAALATAGGCTFTLPERLALSPDGRMAALGCAGHVQLWTLGEGTAQPVLAKVLPVPPGLPAARLAFSRDGGRLLLGADGIAVWRTADWSLEAFLPGTAVGAAVGSPVLALTPNGDGLATTGGFWQLIPSPAEPAG